MSIAIKRNFTIPSTSSIGASELYLTSSVASTTISTGALQVAGGAGVSGVISLGGALKLFNGSFYTGFDSAATANTTYIWPATSPSTGTSVLSSDAAGNLSWILMSASGSGLTLNGLTATTQYFSTSISGSGFTISSIGSTHTYYIGLAGNASTGLISGAAQTLFGLKTFASGVAITSGTTSTSTATGDLTTTGGVGIGGSLWTSSTNYSSISGVGLSNGVVTGTLSGTATSAQILNTTTDNSSTLYILGTRSNGGFAGTSIYVNTGISALGNTITATTFSGTATSAVNAGFAGAATTAVNAGLAGLASNLSGGTQGALHYQSSTNASGFISYPGAGYALTSVGSGTSAVWQTLSTINVGSATTATSAGSAGTAVNAGFAGAATTATNAGFAGSSTNSANTNVTLDTSSTIYLTGSRSNASIGSTPVYVLSGVSALGNTITATTFTGSLSGTASSSALVNIDASTGTRYLLGTVLNTASGSTQVSVGSGITIGNNLLTSGGIAVTNSTASTSTSTGALVVTGGVGIGGSLWTSTNNFSSISGVGHSNGVVTSGVWSGTAISTVNGGTGLVSYTIGDILYASSATILGKITAGTAGSILTSAGAGTTPYWAAATGSTLAIAGTTNGDIQYKSGTALGATSGFNFDSSISTFKISGYPIEAVSSSSANVKLLGGSVSWNGSINGTMLAVNTANTYTGDLLNAQIGGTSRFKVSYTGAVSIGNSYTLPVTDGTVNQVLKTNGSGTVSWSDSIISSAQYNIGYYASAGTALTGSSTFTNNTSTGIVSIGAYNCFNINFYWRFNSNRRSEHRWKLMDSNY